MKVEEIYKRIKEIQVLNDEYSVFDAGNSNCYFGKDYDNNTVFMIDSSTPNLMPILQETKSLKLLMNKKVTVSDDNNNSYNKVAHIFFCKIQEEDTVKAFIRLTKAFSIDGSISQQDISKLFASISSLFDKETEVSETEIQGLFAELYTILFFKKYDCDIARYWQSKQKMKFDFSINEKKRIEVKSTLKQDRVHHFKHEQLLDEIYDIKVVSIKLRKNDRGITLINLVDEIHELYPNNYNLLLYIEKIVGKVNREYIESLRYDQLYLENNIVFIDAKDIPHFNEKTPEGVYNAEYDCNLENISILPIQDMIMWINLDNSTF